MCGIVGGISWNKQTEGYLARIREAVGCLHQRGPDGSGHWSDDHIALGHTRLAIIDTSKASTQPFFSVDERYVLVFNGEIFNYRELRIRLESEGITFRTEGDTEVLLALWIRHGADCLELLNGFFAFAIYDRNKQELFLARDRFGEKPLLIYQNAGTVLFASELKALLIMGIPRSLNMDALQAYLHLNYLPAGILQNTSYLQPGTWLRCSTDGETFITRWFSRQPEASSESIPSFSQAAKILQEKLAQAVKRRLVADVPLGAFLSGGVDSSIVAALAAKEIPQLHTFSIGFPEEPHFDETQYAQLVAKHIGAKHTVFPVSRRELFDVVVDVLEYMDEPFADSSALAVNILSRQVRQHATVALSGDGADELFAGYNKHRATWLSEQKSIRNLLIRLGAPLWKALPASRNTKIGNTVRQLRRFTEGLQLDSADRYWRWAGYTSGSEAASILLSHWHRPNELKAAAHIMAIDFEAVDRLNAVLEADLQLVLQYDMLVKVDRMSMSRSLEVRPPFLDHEVAGFVRQLPSAYKIDRSGQKLLLKTAFQHLLPEVVFSRRKQGFEVPLLHWLRNDLTILQEELLSPDFIRKQELFYSPAIQQLRKQLHSNDPGDAAARIWGLLVFQYWWRKHLS
jgi:asparagine synthase (glutamine-hydrolysing)